jgi:superfamily II DNA or RNA helicase
MDYVLRDYQSESIKLLRDGIRQGHKRQVLMLATGAGKTAIAGSIAKSAVEKGNRVWFIVDSLELVGQALNTFRHIGLSTAVIQGQHEETDYSKPVQVITAQTLTRRWKILDMHHEWWPDLVFIDECFTGDTLVETTKGTINISNVRTGDTVYNANGVGVVEAIKTSRAESIVEVELENGEIIKCTKNHPFFTERGWVNAGELDGFERTFSKQDMQALWNCVLTENKNYGYGKNKDYSSRAVVEEARVLLDLLCEKIKEPNEQAGGEREAAKKNEGDRPRASGSGREWKKDASSSADAKGCSRGSVENGVCCNDKSEVFYGEKDASSLQDRHRKCGKDDSNRSGRIFSRYTSEAGAGQKEGCVFGGFRVVSVTHTKSDGGRIVYNLQVSGHPSYYAGGVLVHNCHIQHKSHRESMERFKKIPFIALSATPFSPGLGKYYSNLINPVTVSQLIEQGYLSTFEVYGPPAVSMKGVKTSAGDWVASEVEKRINKKQIVGDIVSHWMRLASDRVTIVFACNIAHSESICGQFVEAGVNAVHLDGYTDKEERFEIIENFKNGKIQILCSVAVLVKGFDAPRADCAILASPTKSLSRFIQCVGRVMRIHPDKKNALILDHGNNFARLGWIDAPLPAYLDNGEKQEQIKKEDKEKLPTPCQSCAYMSTEFICPNCGFEPTKQTHVEEIKGELKKLSKVDMAEKITWYAMAKGWCREKGWKDGAAYHMYFEKWGVNATRTKVTPAITPNMEFRKWVTHRNIKRAKSRE